MIIIFTLAILLALYRIEIQRNGFHKDPFNIGITHSINGIFIIFVFSSHILQYIKTSIPNLDILDNMGLWFGGHMFQLMVVPFLFFSGYGLTISAETRGWGGYIKTIPKRRCLTVLLNFMVAVSCFAILQIALGNNFTFDKYLLSLICWDSLGNSNWYIFCIIWCYLFSYIAYRVTKNRTSFVICVWFLSCVYILTLHFFKGSWWYDTVLAYPTGVTFTVYRKRIIDFITTRWVKVAIAFFALFGLSYFIVLHHNNALTHNITSIIMCMLMVTLMLKIKVQNRYLEWMGKNLFPLYIYERIPMILFSQDKSFLINYEPLYIIMCIAITLLFGYAYKYFRIKLK